jgi:hypothetical protein
MKENKPIVLLILAIFVTSLACSFSINADLTGNNTSEKQNIKNNEVDEIEAAEETDENNANKNEAEIEATEPGGSENIPQGGGQLRDADEVFEEPPDENEFSSPAGQIYVEVLVKRGPDTSSFTEDLNDGCVEIVGLGTSTVVINRVGEGRDCKEFGGIGLIYGE